MSDDLIDMVCRALGRAWGLGQTYWQQADSESYSQNRKSEETQRKFDALLEETRSALSQPAPQGVADKYAGMYMALADAMGYDSGKDGMEFSPEEFAAALVQERDTLKARDSDAGGAAALYTKLYHDLKARVAELEGDVARDAARWKWLREHWFSFGVMSNINTPFGAAAHHIAMAGDEHTLDVAIDAAIAASKEPK